MVMLYVYAQCLAVRNYVPDSKKVAEYSCKSSAGLILKSQELHREMGGFQLTSVTIQLMDVG